VTAPRRTRTVRYLVALLVIAGTTGRSSAQADAAFAGIPDVTIAYYPVDGGDAMAIRRAIDVVRPIDAHDGRRVDALSSWDLRWSWPRTRHGGCDLAAATIRYTATVRMPQLAATARLTAAERADWDRYVAALARHEAGHVRYTYRHRGDILAAIRGATCRTADAAARAALAGLDAYQIAYDRETAHGTNDGASFPAS
jgi:predicted secreted Zn-dependent protease